MDANNHDLNIPEPTPKEFLMGFICGVCLTIAVGLSIFAAVTSR